MKNNNWKEKYIVGIQVKCATSAELHIWLRHQISRLDAFLKRVYMVNGSFTLYNRNPLDSVASHSAEGSVGFYINIGTQYLYPTGC